MVDWKLYIDSPQQRALDFCGGSLTEGDGGDHLGSGYGAWINGGGWGLGFGYGADNGGGDGDGYRDGYGDGWGDGGGDGYGDSDLDGDGGSATEW